MFSVLILNKKSMKSFNEYYPLFLGAIKNKNIAVCRWNETGGDIDAALPDLHKLTDGKKEWRAIIVRTEDDIDAYEYYEENPYDFIENSGDYLTVEESKIPLVRLTHYLGGFPSPDVEFIPETIKKDGETPKLIYKPSKNVEEAVKYIELCKKYNYDGKKPTEIVLISIRKKTTVDNRERIRMAWTGYNEIESSYFWKRNKYPSNCRFIVHDICEEGPIQKDADLFEFWSAVLLLATNCINPNYLQAYRLYNFGVEFIKKDMEESIQETVTQLIGSRNYFEKTIQDDITKKLQEEKTLPNYEVNVPVSIEAPRKVEFGIKSNKFAVTPTSIYDDNLHWSTMKNEVLDELDKCVERSERALDESADSMRYACEVSENFVQPLDKYQKKEMEKNLSNTYSKIITLQGALPKTSVHYMDKLEDKEKSVKKIFAKRINSSKAFFIANTIALLLLVAVAPAAYCYAMENSGDIKAVVITYAVVIVLLCITELVVLLFQKLELNEKIYSYNQGLKDSVGELSHNASHYSEFISAIATYTRGKSYLKKLATKKFEADNSYVMQQRHIKAVNTFLEKLKKWSDAYHLNVSFDELSDINFVVDYSETPQLSTNYTFISCTEKKVSINNTGDYLDSPFDFVDKFILVREELYDEYGN